MISKFVNLEELYLVDNNITEIPSNAFQRIVGYQNNLDHITIEGFSFKKIGSRPFYSLRNLGQLDIFNTGIDYIPEYAFEFEEESNQIMGLRLGITQMNSSSFHQDSLTHFRRPIFMHVFFQGNHFEYLDENVFKFFLKSNPKNMIFMNDVKIDCDNCKNYWLRKRENSLMIDRIESLSCSNNKKFNNLDNFNECGPYQSIIPCNFVGNELAIYCGGNTDIDLKAMFHNFSKQSSDDEKNFKKFYLNNTYIKVLEENTFDEITFDEIDIIGCDNLTNIDRYAFTATNSVTKRLIIHSNNKLSMDKSIFDVLSNFGNIEFIKLSDIGFNEILSNAFRPINGYQKYLRNLTLNLDVTKIGSHAFSNLKNLTQLTLSIGNLISISDYAFEFEKDSDIHFSIELDHNSNFSAFNDKTLLNIRRPTQLDLLHNNNTHYLDEKVFLPFLLDNEKNTIKLTEVEVFDCNDCRNYWLKKNQNITKRVTIDCSNKKQLNDSDNFKNCTL